VTERARNALAERRPDGDAPAEQRRTIRGLLDAQKVQIARALPKHLDADKFARIVLTEVNRTPKLAECTAPSLLGAVMLAAQLGLEPGPLGHCYLVPYKNKGVPEVQFQLGYKGIIDLARRSGDLVSIVGRAVRPGDHFEFEYGLDEKLVHRPAGDNEDATPTHFYAVAKFKDGGHAFVVLTRGQVEGYRLRSQSQKKGVPPSGAWGTDYEAMAIKTAVRRLAPFLPLTIEAARGVEADDQVVHFTGDGVGDITVERLEEHPEAIDAVADEVATPQAVDGEASAADDASEQPEAQQ
jgi:recombination protein RecT